VGALQIPFLSLLVQGGGGGAGGRLREREGPIPGEVYFPSEVAFRGEVPSAQRRISGENIQMGSSLLKPTRCQGRRRTRRRGLQFQPPSEHLPNMRGEMDGVGKEKKPAPAPRRGYHTEWKCGKRRSDQSRKSGGNGSGGSLGFLGREKLRVALTLRFLKPTLPRLDTVECRT